MQGINFVFFLEKLPGPRLPAARPRTARPGPEIGCAAAAAAASPARSFFSPWPARDSERRPPCRRPCRAASPPLRSAFLSPPPPESPRSSSEDFFLVVVVLLLLLPLPPPSLRTWSPLSCRRRSRLVLSSARRGSGSRAAALQPCQVPRAHQVEPLV